MKKLLLLTFSIFTLSLNSQINWTDLGNTFVGFHQEDQSEAIKKMSHYSPLFGALAFKSGDIKKDWLKAKDLDEKDHLVHVLFNYIEGDDNVTISRRSSDLLLSITPELIGHLLISLEHGQTGWENFKKNYAPQWQKIHIEAERAGSDKKHFFENIKTIKKSYEKFCHNHKNKQKAREYFAALMCLKGETIADIKDYLIGLGITTIDPLTLDDFTIKPYNDFQEYELEILKYLSKSTINLYPKIIYKSVPLCVEQTIGNLINCILYNPTTKKLDLNYLPRDIQKNISPEFKHFIETYSDGPNSFSQEKIDAIVALLSNKHGVIKYNRLIDNQSIEMLPTVGNFLHTFNVLFNVKTDSLQNFGKLISNKNLLISFESLSDTETKVTIKKTISKEQDEKETTAFYNYFITGALSIKKEHAAFSLTEPRKNLTDEAVNELLEKNKKFSTIINTSRSFLSLTGNDLLFKALKQCYEKKYETIAEDLINEEIDVNTQEASSLFTPLLLAIKHKASEKIIKLLIDHGADINAQESYEKTPLHLAMLTYLSLDDERINILLSAHPNVNLKDHEQCTVLNRLIQSLGNESDLLPFIKKLIVLGAEINTTDRFGRSPLSFNNLDEETREYLTEELKKQTQTTTQPDDNE